MVQVQDTAVTRNKIFVRILFFSCICMALVKFGKGLVYQRKRKKMYPIYSLDLWKVAFVIGEIAEAEGGKTLPEVRKSTHEHTERLEECAEVCS